MSVILNQQWQKKRSQLVEVVKNLHQFALDTSDTALAQTLSELRNRIHEPFMFVIVGEVKVGKSSFINALLDTQKEVTKVAPDPCTDTIQQILYGDTEQTVVLNPYLKKIFYPVEILKEIALVDTPGTNTIIQHHQEITERFIPSSDLIVFVFEAKNPYRQSAWDFFDFIHSDWRKKVIFVLQQADLMDAPDLAINVKGVTDFAQKKGIEKPLVFALSAKQELKGNKSTSGFEPLRTYIHDHITGGKAPFLKLENNLQTAQNIAQRLHKNLQTLHQQYLADQHFRADITQTLDQQTLQSKHQANTLTENMLRSYEAIALKTEKKFQEGLSYFSLFKRTFLSIFSKKEAAQTWLETTTQAMVAELNDALNRQLQTGVNDLADHLQQTVKMIDLKIRNSQTILKDNQLIFSDLAEKRSYVLKDLQNEFHNFMNRSDNFMDTSMFPKNPSFSPNIATGSGLAAIGVTLAAVMQGMVFDVTGGILTLAGLAISSLSVSSQRKIFMQEYQKAIEQGQQVLSKEVKQRLEAYIEHIKQKINRNFADFDALLQVEAQQVAQLTERFGVIESDLKDLNED